MINVEKRWTISASFALLRSPHDMTRSFKLSSLVSYAENNPAAVINKNRDGRSRIALRAARPRPKRRLSRLGPLPRPGLARSSQRPQQRTLKGLGKHPDRSQNAYGLRQWEEEERKSRCGLCIICSSCITTPTATSIYPRDIWERLLQRGHYSYIVGGA